MDIGIHIAHTIQSHHKIHIGFSTHMDIPSISSFTKQTHNIFLGCGVGGVDKVKYLIETQGPHLFFFTLIVILWKVAYTCVSH